MAEMQMITRCSHRVRTGRSRLRAASGCGILIAATAVWTAKANPSQGAARLHRPSYHLQDTPCDSVALNRSSGGANGYGPVEGENYCEGIYGRDVSAEVLSFIGLVEPVNLASHDPLQLEWSAPDAAGTILIRAESWHEQSFQMDARLQAGGSFLWNPRGLQIETIPLEQVAFRAWMEGGPSDALLHVPLRVSQGASVPEGADYVFHILPNSRLSEVRVSLAAVEAAGDRPQEFIEEGYILDQSDFPAQTVFPIVLPRSILESPGVYFLEIFATQADAGTLDTMPIWFYHPG